MTVEFHGEDKIPLALDLSDRHGFRWLGVVVVSGKIRRDSRGNVAVVADRVHVVD